MRTFRLVVAYDGTDFHGWQRQPGRRTVQGELETALADALGETVSLRVAGRTDAGVHARGQVTSFRAEARLPVAALVPVLRRRLPPDVRPVRAEIGADGFDARRSARARRYAYRLLTVEDVMWERFAWWPRRRPDAEGLERAVRPLQGEHDFSAFRAAGGTPGSPCCHVLRAGWSRWEGGLRFDVVADHFLYHMVRNLVGTALALMAERDPAGAMREIVASRSRHAAGATAPPQGLSLEEVFYPA